jgi:hypothetical protein
MLSLWASCWSVPHLSCCPLEPRGGAHAGREAGAKSSIAMTLDILISRGLFFFWRYS